MESEKDTLPAEALQRIVELLHRHTGKDFSGYKTTTLSRCVMQRMTVHRLEHPQPYIRFLEESPSELDVLFRELPIGVASCFRECELYDSAPIGYFALDSEGVIANVNSTAASQLGKARKELIGENLSSFVCDSDQDIYDVFTRHLLEDREKHTCELRLQRASGEIYFVRLDGLSNESTASQKLQSKIVAIDITEKKNMESELLRALSKAEVANRAKTEFLASMSHEIRTPLNAIIGIIDILKNSSADPERQALYLRTLDDSANALLALVNDSLDLVKIESRTLDLERTPFDLSDVVRECARIMAGRAAEKKLQLAVEYADDLPHIFVGDAGRIRQIVLNLLQNAIKFTEAGNVTLIVAASPASFSREHKIYIKIADSGIPLDKQQAIFQKFVQQDSSTTRKYGGTGLGLSICQHLAELMNGKIWVDSEEGKGSVFTVCVPLQPVAEAGVDAGQAPEQSRVDAAETPSRTQPVRKILLVEDYEANIMVAGYFLESFGYEHDVARNSQEALQKIENERYSAILMDIQMEGRDGFETTRIIRQIEAREGWPRTPIIAMTAHALLGDEEKCRQAGMDDYLTKPIDSERLRTLLAVYVGGSDLGDVTP